MKLPIYSQHGKLSLVDITSANRLQIPRTYYYTENGQRIIISHAELMVLKQNPQRYYFNTALRLHQRCQAEGEPA